MAGFPTENAVWVETSVEAEKGQWVVYLDVGFWEPNEPDNIQVRRHRIQVYARRRQAEIAAEWIKRAAGKDLAAPPSGF
ncbi:MAG TPA: hypothetical protein PKE64_29350 [Anaerolineae bacterium]|nr:hypothetical protein [Anaerolineae bacterium]HMR68139.1 hypothetical protein [Anaerolineae bacterium]